MRMISKVLGLIALFPLATASCGPQPATAQEAPIIIKDGALVPQPGMTMSIACNSPDPSLGKVDCMAMTSPPGNSDKLLFVLMEIKLPAHAGGTAVPGGGSVISTSGNGTTVSTPAGDVSVKMLDFTLEAHSLPGGAAVQLNPTTLTAQAVKNWQSIEVTDLACGTNQFVATSGAITAGPVIYYHDCTAPAPGSNPPAGTGH